MPSLEINPQELEHGREPASRPVVLLGKYDPAALDGQIMTVVGQADGLHNAGVNVEVWSFSRYILEPQHSKTRTGADIWVLPLFRPKLASVCAMPRGTRRWIEGRLGEIQLFHCHAVFSPIHNQLAKFGKPYVVTPNGGWSTVVFGGRNRLAKRLWMELSEKRFWSGARFVQAVSSGEQERLKELPKMTRIEPIPNGVDLPALDSGAKRDAWVFMGRLAIDHKGLDRMVRAYAICRKKGLALPKLVLAGPDFRGGRQFLTDLIAAHGLEKEIELPGPVNGKEKEALLNRASLFLHTSYWEGLPLSILEAMAHGVPCFVTRGTNFTGVIKESGAGYCAGDSDEEIAAAMASVDKQASLAMGMRARQLIEKEYTWERVAERLVQAYERCCGATFPAHRQPACK
jgi:glycosyltransferase involved in cell wall biosynthesis